MPERQTGLPVRRYAGDHRALRDRAEIPAVQRNLRRVSEQEKFTLRNLEAVDSRLADLLRQPVITDIVRCLHQQIEPFVQPEDHDFVPRQRVDALQAGLVFVPEEHDLSPPERDVPAEQLFPPEQQQQVIVQLANSLQGILTQQLLPTVDRKGRVLACEYLSVDLASRNLMRDADWHKLYTQLELGTQQGMCTMDSSLIRLYEQGRISYDSLLSHVVYPDTVRRKYNRSGI